MIDVALRTNEKMMLVGHVLAYLSLCGCYNDA